MESGLEIAERRIKERKRREFEFTFISHYLTEKPKIAFWVAFKLVNVIGLSLAMELGIIEANTLFISNPWITFIIILSTISASIILTWTAFLDIIWLWHISDEQLRRKYEKQLEK